MVYLEGFGDSGFGGLVDLSLPDTAAAALPQLAKTKAQVLLVRIVFNLQSQKTRSKSNNSINMLYIIAWNDTWINENANFSAGVIEAVDDTEFTQKNIYWPLQRSFCWHVFWSQSAQDAPSSFDTFRKRMKEVEPVIVCKKCK